MPMHIHAGGHTNAPAPAASATSSSPETDTQQLPSLLCLLPSLPNDLQLNTTSRLYPMDLQDLALSCRAAHGMVYSTHVTKLTFTTSNMRELPSRAAMSERYPAVSHIAIDFTRFSAHHQSKHDLASSTEDIQRASECLQSLVLQNSEETMRGITQLDLTVIDSTACRSSITTLAGLLRVCTSLKRLEVRFVLPREQSVFDYIVSPHLVLVLVEQVAGQRLQHHHDLLDHGGDLEQILGSAACRAEMSQLIVKDDLSDLVDTDAVNVACSALPHLSALRDLTSCDVFIGRHIHYLLASHQSQLTMLTNLEFTLSEGVENPPFLLDLPALRQLTCCAQPRVNGTTSPMPLCFSTSMQSLTRLNLNRVRLEPVNNIQVLSSLQHLTLKDCATYSSISSLTSDIEALPSLTSLRVDSLQDAGDNELQGLACNLQLETATRLLELSLICRDLVNSAPSVPANLTSLKMDVLSVCLPARWISLTQLVHLDLNVFVGAWDWRPTIFPVVAQITALEHLHLYIGYMAGTDNNGDVLDASCLGSLTQLTCLKLFSDYTHLCTPKWPLLVQAARLQLLAVGWYCDWSTLLLPPSLVELDLSAGDEQSISAVQLPHALSSCSALRALRVGLCGNAAINNISIMSPMTTLQELDLPLGENSAISEAGLAIIAQLTNLQSLRLKLRHASAGSLRCLGSLKQLTRLKLQSNIDDIVCEDETEEALLQLEGVFPRLREVF